MPSVVGSFFNLPLTTYQPPAQVQAAGALAATDLSLSVDSASVGNKQAVATVSAAAQSQPGLTAAVVSNAAPAQGAAVVSKVADTHLDTATNVVADATIQNPQKAAAIVAHMAQTQPTQAKNIVTRMATQKPATALQLVGHVAKTHPWEALALGAAAIAGSATFIAVNAGLSVRNNVHSVKDATKAITAEKLSGKTLKVATAQGLKATGESALQVAPGTKLDKLGRLGSGLSVLSGLNAAFTVGTDARNFKRDHSFVHGDAVASDALNMARGMNDAAKLIKNSPVGLIAPKAAPVLSLALDGTDAVRRVAALKGPDTSTQARFSDTAYLASDSLDAVGSGLMLSGVGLPAGVALKVGAAGASIAGVLAQHYTHIKDFIKKLA